ncbi:MAG: DUF1194 domain-containing protein [Rubricella sp.]
MMWRSAIAACLVATAAPASECRLALLLAIDISQSVSVSEYALQREGTAAAFEDPEIRATLLSGRPVAIAAFEWSGERETYLRVPWRLLESEADIDAVAATIRGGARPFGGNTAAGRALETARDYIDDAPACDARTIDISTDGPNNAGPQPDTVTGAPGWGNVTVNALVINGDDAPELVARWLRGGIRGEHAFVEVAADFEDYARAFRRKLLREIEPPLMLGRLE